MARISEVLLEPRCELAQLGRDARIGAEKRPAGVVDRAGVNLRDEACGQEGAHGGERCVGLTHALGEPPERRTRLQGVGDRLRLGGRWRGSAVHRQV